MDLKGQELRRRRLPPQQGRGPPQPPKTPPQLRDAPRFLFIPSSLPCPAPAALPLLLPCDEGLAVPRQTRGSPFAGGWLGWGEDNEKGPNASFSTANAKSPGRLCSVPGPVRCDCNTNYLFMKRPCCRSGFMAAVRGWVPSRLLRTSVPSLQHCEHLIAVLPIHREGPKQQEALASPVRRLFFNYFFFFFPWDC